MRQKSFVISNIQKPTQLASARQLKLPELSLQVKPQQAVQTVFNNFIQQNKRRCLDEKQVLGFQVLARIDTMQKIEQEQDMNTNLIDNHNCSFDIFKACELQESTSTDMQKTTIFQYNVCQNLKELKTIDARLVLLCAQTYKLEQRLVNTLDQQQQQAECLQVKINLNI